MCLIVNAVHNALLSVIRRLACVTVTASSWRFIAGRGLTASLQGERVYTVTQPGFISSTHDNRDEEVECRQNNLTRQGCFVCGKLLK